MQQLFKRGTMFLHDVKMLSAANETYALHIVIDANDDTTVVMPLDINYNSSRMSDDSFFFRYFTEEENIKMVQELNDIISSGSVPSRYKIGLQHLHTRNLNQGPGRFRISFLPEDIDSLPFTPSQIERIRLIHSLLFVSKEPPASPQIFL